MSKYKLLDEYFNNDEFIEITVREFAILLFETKGLIKKYAKVGDSFSEEFIDGKNMDVVLARIRDMIECGGGKDFYANKYFKKVV